MQSSFFHSSTAYAALILLQNLTKARGGGMPLPTNAESNPGTGPEGEKSWKLKVQKRNMLRNWWRTQGCSKHCQSRSDLPQSRDSGLR